MSTVNWKQHPASEKQLYWINITGYPTFQAHRGYVKNYSFDNQAYLFMEQVWLEK